jgi:alkaline phosphatase
MTQRTQRKFPIALPILMMALSWAPLPAHAQTQGSDDNWGWCRIMSNGNNRTTWERCYQDDSWLDRLARGDLAQPGGARRLDGDQTEALRAALSTTKNINVILLIGDGMGDSEITAARNYAEGAGGMFKGIDALPFTGQYTHYALSRTTRKPDYVTDSAASATAWSTGVKTYNGALGVDIDGKSHPTLLELAKAAGKATGNVSTAEIQDATPAALFAHVASRSCYGPTRTLTLCPESALENGGPGSITEQLLQARADVTLGGGAQTFTESAHAGPWQGKTLFQQAEGSGYQIVRNLDELQSITAANQQTPLLGLFADGNMPIRWKGPQASYRGNLDQSPVVCTDNPERQPSVPTLAQMTEKAIELLSRNPNGFFLQVEGASIDKQDHVANPCGQFGETVDLDEAVQVALEFARRNRNTLVVVTADHAHSSQIIAVGSTAPGLTQTLITKDDAPMAISYGNSETESQGHTGAQLRIAAYGPRAANVTGLTDQTDLFFTLLEAMGLRSPARP